MDEVNEYQENYITGWIKVYRSIEKHWIWEDSKKLKAWITILLYVNHVERKINIGNELFICKKGESLRSLDSWAKIFGKGWDKSKVRRFLKLLKNDHMIDLKSERKTTRLIVCNYDNYQLLRNDNETIMKRKRNDNETQTTPNKNDKNDKNEEELINKQKEFEKEVLIFQEKYEISLLKEFFRYWSEPNIKKTKMKKELEQTWDTSRRLVTWYNNSLKFKK